MQLSKQQKKSLSHLAKRAARPVEVAALRDLARMKIAQNRAKLRKNVLFAFMYGGGTDRLKGTT